MSTRLMILFSLLSSALSTSVHNNGVDNGYHDNNKRTVDSNFHGPNSPYHNEYSNSDYNSAGSGAVSYSHFIQDHAPRPALIQSHHPKQHFVPQFHHGSHLFSAPVQPVAYKVQPLPLALDRSFPVSLTKYPVQVIKPFVPYYVEKPVPVQVEERKDFVQTKVPLVYHAIYECCKDKLDHQPNYVLTKVPLVYHATFPENPTQGGGFSEFNGAPSDHRNY